MRRRAVARVAAALAAAFALAAPPAAGQAAADLSAADLSGRWSGAWVEATDAEPVPLTIALETLGGGVIEATVTYRQLSGRPFDRRFLGTRSGAGARFDMGDGQFLICRLDASGRLRVQIVNPRSTTGLVLERDPHTAPEGEGSRPASVALEPPPAAAGLETAPETALETVPETALARPTEAGSELGVWSGSWQPRADDGGGPIRVVVADAGDGMRRLEISGIAGATEPAMVDAVQLRSQGLVLPVGPGRDLVVMLERDERFQLRLLLPDTVLMTALTKQGVVTPAVSALRDQEKAPLPEPVVEPAEEAAPVPLPRRVADLPGSDLPLRPGTPLPGPVTAGDALAEAYAGIWVGQWDDGRTAALVLADVTASSARLLYVTRQEDAPDGDAPPESALEEAALHAGFENDVLIFSHDGASYRLMRTGREVADASAVGIPGRSYGIFMRAWYPPRMPAPQPDPRPEASGDTHPETD